MAKKDVEKQGKKKKTWLKIALGILAVGTVASFVLGSLSLVTLVRDTVALTVGLVGVDVLFGGVAPKLASKFTNKNEEERTKSKEETRGLEELPSYVREELEKLGTTVPSVPSKEANGRSR